MTCTPGQFPYAIQLLLVSVVEKRRNGVKSDICGHVINLLCLCFQGWKGTGKILPFMFLRDMYLSLPTVSFSLYKISFPSLSTFFLREVVWSTEFCLLLLHIFMRWHTSLMYVNLIQPLSCKFKKPNTWMTEDDLMEIKGCMFFSNRTKLLAISRQKWGVGGGGGGVCVCCEGSQGYLLILSLPFHHPSFCVVLRSCSCW